MLERKFLDLMSKYSESKSYNSECWTEIKNNYLSKNRHYHNLEHLENMLIELDKTKSLVKDLDTLLFSIFYHDMSRIRSHHLLGLENHQ